MAEPFQLIPSLSEAIAVPDEGILSKPVFSDARMRVTLFGFAQGQEMTEHTTTMEAMIQVLEGKATVTLGGNRFEAGAGTWVQMEPSLPHNIVALTPLKLMLIVLRA